ncbi:MAG: hypothetical protein K6L75_03560 [Cellvibrionaceae bacterium]
MPDLYIPSTATRPTELCDSQPENLEQFLACNPEVNNQDQWLSPHVAYDVTGTPSPTSSIVLQQLNRLPIYQRENLSGCVATFGDGTTTVAKFYDQHIANLDFTKVSQDTNGLAGVGAAVLGGRTDSFQAAIEQYQRALIQLNNYHRVGRVAAKQKLELRNKVINAYENLNRYYQQELRRIVPADSLTKNKGSALSNADRGITLAERHRGRGIHVANMTEGQQVSKLATGLRFAGRGAIVLDAGFRINTVRNSYLEGGEWKRELAMQTGGLGVSALTGFSIGRAAFFASRIALMATPWGWGIIIASSVVSGAILAYQADQLAQRKIGNAWKKDAGQY